MVGVSLHQLLDGLPVYECRGGEQRITGIAYDSRQVQRGDLFVCIRGERFDGHDFIPQALERGAVAVLVQERLSLGDLPYALVDDSRGALGSVAAKFYDYPASKMGLIGITGTNGKTTTTYMIRQILTTAGYKVGLFGTIQNMIGEEILPAQRTTPESLDLQRTLAQMYEQGVQWVVMEVSSHAIQLERIKGCSFDVGIFTNITQDHLDFHGDFASYLAVKARFFTQLGLGPVKKDSPLAIINGDDPYYRKIMPPQGRTLLYGIHNQDLHWRGEEIIVDSQGIAFQACRDGERIPVRTSMTGRFNVYNALAAIACGGAIGVPGEVVAEGLRSMTGVPGRFERVDCGQDFTVIVDYAHTPDGLENVLQAARAMTPGRLIVVFGCGGDRDRSKRPLMGAIAGKYGDYIIVTSDNPRSEDPAAICAEIEGGLAKTGADYTVEIDRRAAIDLGISRAQRGDLVLIAGKGHETGQQFKDYTIPFDDRQVAAEVLRERI
ncbi:MAG: UDP-N-acetylmuramoyl-L-alanyl-D-glutamate--2,6-diaminopimelate ligase [Limnochordia bacterium]|jgi:UDP-N-acetylmuramoyl-L-alanyl-D-glutamate--2,6-diaminopimelate ligase